MNSPQYCHASLTDGLAAMLSHQLSIPVWVLLLAVVVLLVVGVIMFCRHQRALCVRAWLMDEAIRNGDFSFRLSAGSLPRGERALQESLNGMGQKLKLLADKREVESWQRLTRVLTHEMMNALAPITSITQAWLSHASVSGTPYEDGVRAIHDTATGLASFVQSYRKLTQLQQPALDTVDVGQCIAGMAAMHPHVQWHVQLGHVPPVMADAGMLRQVLANLVKNACEAHARNIGVCWSDGALLLSNDGAPIPMDVRGDIFVPFFTTKRTGNGIGLPFSRQLMMVQGGGLSLLAVPVSGYHTTFAISFGV